MVIRLDDTSSDEWKQKYFDHLAHYEAEEERWRRTEEILQRTLNRVALAAEGVHPDLDTQLERLRNKLREHTEPDSLESVFNAISEILTELEHRHQRGRNKHPGAWFSEVLGEVRWPREIKKQVRELQRKLGDISYPYQLAEVTTDVSALFNSLLNPADTQNTSGILSGLFGRSTNGNGKSKAIAEDDAIELARSVLQHIMRAFEKDQSVAEPRLNSVKERLLIANEPRELEQLADDVSRLLGAPLTTARVERRARPSTKEEGYQKPNAVLIELLERMSIPTELDSQVSALRETLSQNIDAQRWPAVLGQICDLVVEVRRKAQREKQDLEEFLSEVLTNLKELDDRLQGAKTDHDAGLRSGEQLRDAVEAEVKGIASSVAEAVDLSQLKEIVEDRLDQIRKHVDTFRDSAVTLRRDADERMRALTERIHDLEDEADELRSNIREQRSKALRDPLTGIANRLAYDERIEHEYARWKRFREPTVLMVWDVDHFKQINDSFGHKAGDRLLAAIAKLLANEIRETDFIARYGGEEFIILAPGINASQALTLADKLRSRIEHAKIQHGDTPVPVTISCGIAQFAEDFLPEEVFDHADKALYRAKEQGRNRCIVAE